MDPGPTTSNSSRIFISLDIIDRVLLLEEKSSQANPRPCEERTSLSRVKGATQPLLLQYAHLLHLLQYEGIEQLTVEEVTIDDHSRSPCLIIFAT
jgi:hypothetical protein